MYTTRFLTVMRRVTVAEAAKLLGITPDGVRMRVRRGSIEHEKDENGRVVVYVDEAELDRNEVQDTSPNAYLATLQEQIEQLRNDVEDWKEELRQEREANRENRRLLAAALERVPPALEAPKEEPSEAPGGPQPASEEPYSTHSPRRPPKPETPISDEAEPGAPYGTSRQEAEDSLQPRKRSWWREFLGME
jgi:TolA-binding protein